MLKLSRLDRTSAQTLTAAELATLRDYLHLVTGEETDAALLGFFSAAEDAVERRCGHVFRPSAWRATYGGSGDTITLPLYPLASLTVVTVDGSDPLSADAYTITAGAGCEILTLSTPATSSLVVDANFGYYLPLTPPAAGIAAVYMAAADFYIHREAGTETEIRDNPAFKRLICAVGFIRGGGGLS